VIAGVAGYVYQQQAWLVTDITAPKDLTIGDTVTISADANWLLCREACVPQQSKLVVKLKIGASLTPNPAFDPASHARTTPLDETRFKAKSTAKAAVLSFSDRLSDIRGVRYFPSDPTFFGAEVADVKATSTGIILSVPLSKYAPGPPKRMTGILVIPEGDAKGAHWVDVKVTEH
jgi:DsbC/DsbD-like thiol-disulfide interchange protein